MLESKARPNHLGPWGWVGKGSWGLDRYLYTLHRLTGIAILFYFLLHILLTSSRALGQGSWEASMARVSHPIFLLGEYLVFAAFAFHAINGVRLALAEVGIGVGKPIEPIYPYRSVVHVQRPAVLAVLILALLVSLIGAVDFFVL